VKFAYGDLNVAGVRARCGSSRQQQAPVYDVYQLYVAERHLGEETFFATITRMLKADDITATARRVSCHLLACTSRLTAEECYGRPIE